MIGRREAVSTSVRADAGGDGPPRRRIIRGTMVRIGGQTMRYGPRPNSRLKTARPPDEALSCVRCRDLAVITGYQRDLSSKRPRVSVVLAVRSSAAPRDMSHETLGVQDSAPCGRRLRRSWTPSVSCDATGAYEGKLTLALERPRPPSKHGET